MRNVRRVRHSVGTGPIWIQISTTWRLQIGKYGKGVQNGKCNGGRFLVVSGYEQDLALDWTLDTTVISHEECWKGREDDGDSSGLKANIQVL